MKVSLEIIASEVTCADQKIDDLREKEIVPKMMLRRRLTRASKIMLYLAESCRFKQGAVVYGSAYGELPAIAEILSAIYSHDAISPTAFQNSVYNTPASYFSILHQNYEEILTVSSGDQTSQDVLKTAALQALYHQTDVLALCTETINIDNINEVNSCSQYLESGVACRLRLSDKEPTIFPEGKIYNGFMPSLNSMLELHEKSQSIANPVVAISL